MALKVLITIIVSQLIATMTVNLFGGEHVIILIIFKVAKVLASVNGKIIPVIWILTCSAVGRIPMRQTA